MAETPQVGLQLRGFESNAGGRLGETQALAAMQSSWGIFQGVPYCIVPQPHTGFNYLRQKIDLGAWRQSKEAYCYLWENIPACELWIYLKLKLEPAFQLQDWLLSVLSILWWAAVQSSLAFLHGWSPNSHGITSSAWPTASETGPPLPKVTWANLPTWFDFWIKQVLDVPEMFPHIEIPLWKGMWKVSEMWEKLVFHSYFLL